MQDGQKAQVFHIGKVKQRQRERVIEREHQSNHRQRDGVSSLLNWYDQKAEVTVSTFKCTVENAWLSFYSVLFTTNLFKAFFGKEGGFPLWWKKAGGVMYTPGVPGRTLHDNLLVLSRK